MRVPAKLQKDCYVLKLHLWMWKIFAREVSDGRCFRYPPGSLLQYGQTAADGQPQAGTPKLAGYHVVGLTERLKDSLLYFL